MVLEYTEANDLDCSHAKSSYKTIYEAVQKKAGELDLIDGKQRVKNLTEGYHIWQDVLTKHEITEFDATEPTKLIPPRPTSSEFYVTSLIYVKKRTVKKPWGDVEMLDIYLHSLES